MKHNPLFVDSTKFIGDSIRCRISLVDILLHDGEKVFIQLRDRFGVSHRAEMKPNDSGVLECQLLLGHQKEIQFSFEICNDRYRLFRSAERSMRVRYEIVEAWEPLPEELKEVIAQATDDSNANKSAGTTEQAQLPPAKGLSDAKYLFCDQKTQSELKNLDHLMDKWGF